MVKADLPTPVKPGVSLRIARDECSLAKDQQGRLDAAPKLRTSSADDDELVLAQELGLAISASPVG